MSHDRYAHNGEDDSDGPFDLRVDSIINTKAAFLQEQAETLLETGSISIQRPGGTLTAQFRHTYRWRPASCTSTPYPQTAPEAPAPTANRYRTYDESHGQPQCGDACQQHPGTGGTDAMIMVAVLRRGVCLPGPQAGSRATP